MHIYESHEVIEGMGKETYLRPVSRPVCFVVEGARVPDCFEEDLGETNGVCGGAGTSAFEGAGGGVCDVFAGDVGQLSFLLLTSHIDLTGD
jgi:hypothetical protein